MNLQEIDKNFAVETHIDKEDVVFHDVTEDWCRLYGVTPPVSEKACFRRMPEEVAVTVNAGVAQLNNNSAGGRVRFCTDSPYVAIHAEVVGSPMLNMSPYGRAGFDLYMEREDGQAYLRTFGCFTNIVDLCHDMPSREMREYTLTMPLYSGVRKLYIGLAEDAVIQPPRPYTYEKPVVFYGSSITQGGCASRSGNSYQGFISRRLDMNYLNLGFSGSAQGEPTMAEYIAGLDMSVLVYDYDHNAPTPDHLEATHKPMFDIIRKAQPDLPIVMVSKPSFRLCEGDMTRADTDRRFAIIKATYEAAVAAGDKNVYLIDGREMMAELTAGEGTCDAIHPNDLGFAAMAKAIGGVLEKILSYN